MTPAPATKGGIRPKFSLQYRFTLQGKLPLNAGWVGEASDLALERLNAQIMTGSIHLRCGLLYTSRI